MKKSVYGLDGNKLRDIELSDDVFGCDASTGTVYYAIRNELANMRIGTACTKTRGEVATRSGARGTSTRKPWRQKGTGRARAGRKGSPVWVGGGTAFGPKPRDYSYKMPRKMKQAAMKIILSMRNKEDKLKIVEDFNVETGRTKDLLKAINKIVDQNKTVIILQDDGSMIKRAGRNVPWLNCLSFNRLRAHDIFYGGTIVILESAAKKLNEFYKK